MKVTDQVREQNEVEGFAGGVEPFRRFWKATSKRARAAITSWYPALLRCRRRTWSAYWSKKVSIESRGW
jgi:hypothetical protein